MQTEQDPKQPPLVSMHASEHMCMYTTPMQHPFKTEVSTKLGTEVTCINIIKVILDTPIANIIGMGRS